MSNIGDKIKRQRKAAKLTQWELAAKMEPPVTGVTIGKYEMGKTTPNVSQLESIAKATNARLILEFYPNTK